MQCWGQSSLIFEVPPEAYHNSITQKSEVTLQKRRLQFLAPNLMCKHSYHKCNHGNNKEGCESLISGRRINKCSIQIQSSSGQVDNIKSYYLIQALWGYATLWQQRSPERQPFLCLGTSCCQLHILPVLIRLPTPFPLSTTFLRAAAETQNQALPPANMPLVNEALLLSCLPGRPYLQEKISRVEQRNKHLLPSNKCSLPSFSKQLTLSGMNSWARSGSPYK